MNSSFSGCEFEINREHETLLKYSPSVEYRSRLLMQAQKQAIFHKFNTNKNIVIPNVVSIRNNGFIMEYMPDAIDHLSLFENDKIINIKKYVDNVLNFIDTNLSKSYYVDGLELEKYKSITMTKLSSINLHGMVSKKERQKLVNLIEKNKEPLLIGQCHGDLTLNNILSDGSNIVIIDFLDSFIDSPIIDIIKIQQDTCNYWSILLKERGDFSSYKKTLSVYSYINERLGAANIKCRKWVAVLEILNYMRILPYAAEKNKNLEYLSRIINTKIGAL